MRSEAFTEIARRLQGVIRHGVLGESADQRPMWILFVVVFSLVFLLSGLLTMATSYFYRMGLVSALVIPLILLYGIELDAVFSSFLALVLAIMVSAIVNHSSFHDFILFMRIPAFSYLMYYLARSVIDHNRAPKVFRFSIVVAVIQLPIVLLQHMIVGGADSGYGTFNFVTDYAMAFFIILVLIVVLFGSRDLVRLKYRLPITFWLTLTVFATNAQMPKILVLMVWFFYLFSRISLRRFLATSLVAVATTGMIFGLARLGMLRGMQVSFLRSLPASQDFSNGATRDYLEGGYDRVGAIGYFLSQPVNWFGDGPSKYFDVFTREYIRGNMGHVYTFYSETGIASLLLSWLVLFTIAFTQGWRFKASMVGTLSFVSIIIMAFTSQVMNDIAVMLIYSLVAQLQWFQESSPPTLGDLDSSRAELV